MYEVLIEFWENLIYPELQKKANKADVDQQFKQLRAGLKNEIRDNRRLIQDLQMDTPTKSEFTRLEKRVKRLEDRVSN